ncbi:MAG: hypothetical protein JXR48_11895 [Candidatus Delongbacteria bacterium]|nr:hypothetical protein [Candidatus Delongbacteria bacterium]MBN2835654.1 hypothetical protein [Candidatus Delongbacteria bacterium]
MEFFKENHILSSYHTSPGNRMKLQSILSFCENIASNHASDCGYGFLDLFNKGFFWVLHRISIRFLENELPGYHDNFGVRTRPTDIKNLSASREFFFEKGGVDFLIVNSNWVVLDIMERKPVRTKKIEELKVDLKDYRNIVSFHSPGLLEDSYISHVYKIRFSDTDMNAHVNNSKYLEIATDFIAEKNIKIGLLDEIHIEFNKETKYGNDLEIRYNKDGLHHNFNYLVKGNIVNKILIIEKGN